MERAISLKSLRIYKASQLLRGQVQAKHGCHGQDRWPISHTEAAYEIHLDQMKTDMLTAACEVSRLMLQEFTGGHKQRYNDELTTLFQTFLRSQFHFKATEIFAPDLV